MPYVVRLNEGTCAYGPRILWSDLSFELHRGEFVAVLGPNGAGKTSLLKVLLGQLPLIHGSLKIAPNVRLGYVPQQKDFTPHTLIRGRDLIGLGLDGHRLGLLKSKDRKAKVDAALDAVDAQAFADSPITMLSGGEQQRLRIAQSLVLDPSLLLLDEPLLSLDIANQQIISEVVSDRKEVHDTAILCVTHDINPIYPLVNRVIYVANGHALIGTPDDVITSESLSTLYQTDITVLRKNDEIFIAGGNRLKAPTAGENPNLDLHGQPVPAPDFGPDTTPTPGETL